MNRELRIVFLGTPEFASASLKALIDHGCNIVAVVTAPDKPAGRGKKISEPDVKRMANSYGLKVLQPVNLKSSEFVEQFRALDADLGIVVAFRMLPEVIWSMPAFGTFNLHASLLPNYRGAAPINHAIINGEKETGVSTFFLKHDIDTGDIILQQATPIGHDETVGELHDRLMMLGASLVVKTVEVIKSGDFSLIRQTDFVNEGKILQKAPKIYKEDCKINWQEPAERVYHKINGLSPYPAAFTVFKNPMSETYPVKLYKVKMNLTSPLMNVGKIETDGKNQLSIFCTGGMIEVLNCKFQEKNAWTLKVF